MDSFDAELKTLAKTCNFCDCLRDSLIRDRIVLGIKNEQTTKKLLRIRYFALSRCIDICRSQEVAESQIKSLSEPADNINQVKSKKKKREVPTPDGRSGKTIPCKFCAYDHAPERKKCPAWSKVCKRWESNPRLRKGMRSRHPIMWLVATVFTYGIQMSRHHRTRGPFLESSRKYWACCPFLESPGKFSSP